MNSPLFIFKSIWFADDDPDDAAFFEDALKQLQWNASFTVITSGAVLLESLKLLPPPDLLFLDLYMPIVDGKKCLRIIRNTLKLKQLPIIMYSSSSHRIDVADCYKLGAHLYVKKPDSYGAIIRTIKQIMCLDWQHPSTIASHFFIDNNYVPFRAHE
jgi:CheY-like chemotaxis protein